MMTLVIVALVYFNPQSGLQSGLQSGPQSGPQILRRSTATHARAAVQLKKEDTHEPSMLLDVGAIVEFHDPHKMSKMAPLLGIVEAADTRKDKVTLVDASGTRHAVESKFIHISLGTYKGKLKEPSDILKEYTAIAAASPAELVQPELLEMAWELCADADEPSVSAKSILEQVDGSMYKTQLDVYRAYKLLTSDLGKVFFKTLSNVDYKAKTRASVQASKEHWCESHAQESDFCTLASS